MVSELDTGIGPIKQRARGLTGGRLLLGMATAQLVGQGLPGRVGPGPGGRRRRPAEPGAGRAACPTDTPGATTLDPAPDRTRAAAIGEPSPLLALLANHSAADTVVARRSLAAYQQLGEHLAGGADRGQVSA